MLKSRHKCFTAAHTTAFANEMIQKSDTTNTKTPQTTAKTILITISTRTVLTALIAAFFFAYGFWFSKFVNTRPCPVHLSPKPGVLSLRRADKAIELESNEPPLAPAITDANVLHTVATKRAHHGTAMEIVNFTWLSEMARYTYVVTDADDAPFERRMPRGRVVTIPADNARTTTSTGPTMAQALDVYILRRTDKVHWWCHWTDETYVNSGRLLALLTGKDWHRPWYVGRPASDAASGGHLMRSRCGDRVKIWFAHQGGGVCLSHALVELVAPLVRDMEIHQVFEVSFFNFVQQVCQFRSHC